AAQGRHEHRALRAGRGRTEGGRRDSRPGLLVRHADQGASRRRSAGAPRSRPPRRSRLDGRAPRCAGARPRLATVTKLEYEVVEDLVGEALSWFLEFEPRSIAISGGSTPKA